MSLPRELSVKDGRLFQKPVRELDLLRRNEVFHKGVSFEGTISLEGVKGRMVDL